MQISAEDLARANRRHAEEERLASYLSTKEATEKMFYASVLANDVVLPEDHLIEYTQLMQAIKELDWALAAAICRTASTRTLLAVTAPVATPGTQPGLSALMGVAFRQAPAVSDAQEWADYTYVAGMLLDVFSQAGLIDLKNKAGFTALHQACGTKNAWFVDQLIQHGASVLGELGALCFLCACRIL